MDFFPALTVVLLLAGGAWLVLSPVVVFRVRISNGAVRVTKGKVSRGLLDQVAPICREWNIRRGWFGGVRGGRRFKLVFSRGIPPACRQQIRNLWVNG